MTYRILWACVSATSNNTYSRIRRSSKYKTSTRTQVQRVMVYYRQEIVNVSRAKRRTALLYFQRLRHREPFRNATRLDLCNDCSCEFMACFVGRLVGMNVARSICGDDSVGVIVILGQPITDRPSSQSFMQPFYFILLWHWASRRALCEHTNTAATLTKSRARKILTLFQEPPGRPPQWLIAANEDRTFFINYGLASIRKL